MSAGERIFSGSPSWIQPAVKGSGPFPQWEVPGGRRARAPAQCPSTQVFC